MSVPTKVIEFCDNNYQQNTLSIFEMIPTFILSPYFGLYAPLAFLNSILMSSLLPLKKLIFVGVFPVFG